MRVLFRSVACLVAALTACTSDPVGQSFASESELTQAIGDCAVIGRFRLNYPLRVIRIETGENGLRFDFAGTPHEYGPEFGTMQAVFVENGTSNGVLVVRANARP